MRRNPFIFPRVPVATSHADIETWTRATKEAFAPFVRRRSVLVKHRDIFRTEFVNLIPVIDHPPSARALKEAVRMCRRAIYIDPQAAHAHQIKLFSETSHADSHWLALVTSTKQLDLNADLADRAAQLMALIDGIAEGCLKARITYLFGFAHRLAHGVFPLEMHDFGRCIAEWPVGVAPNLRRLMEDPIFNLPISQWRNIAAHRSYRRIGPDLFEATYGRAKVKKSVNLSYGQLDEILAWTKQVLGVCRMANVIIDIEFMRELRRHGLPDPALRFDAYVMTLSHSMRMVGFTYFGEIQSNKQILVLYRDDLSRNPRDAIVHASQVLDQLALASTSDITLQDTIEEVGIGLVASEGDTYASAVVKVEAALKKLDQELSLEEYIHQIDFWLSPNSEYAC